MGITLSTGASQRARDVTSAQIDVVANATRSCAGGVSVDGVDSEVDSIMEAAVAAGAETDEVSLQAAVMSVSAVSAAMVGVRRAEGAQQVILGIILTTSRYTHAAMEATAVTPTTDGSSAVSLDGVCVHRGATVALAPTTLAVALGSSVALVGPNGSGKTTLLHLMGRLLAPTDGAITGAPRVALVAQHQDHHPWMPLSVDEVLRMGRYRGMLHRLHGDDRVAIDAAARRLEIDALRTRRFGELSGGERQRVMVARAVAAQADLVLLDEPITGLDLPSQEIILEVIAGEASRGAAVVFSTHHLGEARRADRVILLAGCVLADGTPDDVLTPALLAEAFGGRMLHAESATIVVDEHHHGHGAHTDSALSGHLDHHDHAHHDHAHHHDEHGGHSHHLGDGTEPTGSATAQGHQP
jgi:manganese transport system ATP-binding protein